MQPQSQNCKNCGSLLTGKYCSHCGEKVYTEKDKSVKHIIGEGFHFITHIEGTYLLTLKTIFRHPGKYSEEYCAGLRKKYFKPVSFFLIGVVIYLLFPLFQGLNISFNSAVNTFKFLNTTEIVLEKARAENITMAELAQRYHDKSGKIAKLLLLILLPLKAVVLYILFGRNRKRFFDHFIMATEITSFYLYFSFIFLPLFLLLISFIVKLFGGDAEAIFTDSITMPLYLIAMTWAGTKAFKRFYDVPLIISFPKTLLFLLCHAFIVFMIYRIILFFLVLLFI
jgi:hypothetical protein